MRAGDPRNGKRRQCEMVLRLVMDGLLVPGELPYAHARCGEALP